MDILEQIFGKPRQAVRPRVIGQPGTFDVKMPIDAYLKLKYYINNMNGEIGGIGCVRLEGNTFVVDDMFIVRQRARSGDFELNDTALALRVNSIANTKPELLPELKMWWHSHNGFATFWSSTDDATFERLLNHDKKMDFILGIVGNKKGELLARVDVESNIGVIRFDNLHIKVKLEDKVLESAIQSEIKEKVNR